MPFYESAQLGCGADILTEFNDGVEIASTTVEASQTLPKKALKMLSRLSVIAVAMAANASGFSQ